MNAQISNVSSSAMGKFALSFVSTATAYFLVPVAFHYAAGTLSQAVVLTVVAVWMLSLIRMWGEVVSVTTQYLIQRGADLRTAELLTFESGLEDAASANF